MSSDDSGRHVERVAQIWADDDLATEKELREALLELGKQAHDHGLADFAVDQMYEDARSQFRSHVREESK